MSIKPPRKDLATLSGFFEPSPPSPLEAAAAAARLTPPNEDTATLSSIFGRSPPSPFEAAAAAAGLTPPNEDMATLSSIFGRSSPSPLEAAAAAARLTPPNEDMATLSSIFGRSSPSPLEAAAANLTPPPKRKCYVGMTMNLARRKREHERRYGEIHKWEEHGPYFSKTAAQAAENQLAGVRCDSNEGGRGDEFALWYVYSFEHEE